MAAQPDDVLLMMGCYTEDNETKGDEENPSPTEDKDQPNSEVTKETTQKNSAAPDIEADSLISLSAIIAAKRKESTDSKESNGPEKKKSRKSKAPQRFVDFVDEVPGLDDDIQDIDDDLPEQETSFKLEPTWDDDDLIENDIDGDVNANMTGTPSVANNFPEMAKQLHRTPSSSGLHRSPLSSSMETTLVSGKPTLLNTGFNAGEEKVGVWAHRNLMPNCDVCHQKMFSPKDAGRHKDCHAGTLFMSHQCGGCLRLFRSRKWFQNHVRKSHGALGYYKCMYCHAVFHNLDQFIGHCNTHPDDAQRYIDPEVMRGVLNLHALYLDELKPSKS